MKLHSYWRSSASWRVRIALGLKGLHAEYVPQHLRRGDQHSTEYLALNPQGLVPTLELDDGTVLTQSLAIIAWLDETYPDPPLLSHVPLQRARERAFAHVIACDTHPVQNLKVLRALRRLGYDQAAVNAWAADVNVQGLTTCQALLPHGADPFCFGAMPSIADICLVPQLGNARGYGVNVQRFPRLLEKESACQLLPAFADAVPERQPDAEEPA